MEIKIFGIKIKHQLINISESGVSYDISETMVELDAADTKALCFKSGQQESYRLLDEIKLSAVIFE